MGDDLISLAVFELDCPAPAAGWTAELARRGVAVVLDDLGRRSIPRAVARDLLTEHRENEARKARHREEIERQAIEADQRFRASLPSGIPAGQIPEGLTPGMLLMLSDSERQGSRRRSVVEDALAHAGTVFTPIREES